jgi:hypothetical protein
LVAGLAEGDRRIVVDRLGVHRADEAKIIGDAREVREQFAHPRPALTLAGEAEDRGGHRKTLLARGHRGEPLPLADRFGQILAALRLHLRLGIEEVHLRGRAGLEEVDDPLCLRGMVRERRSGGSGGGSRASQQPGQRRGAEGGAAALQEKAAVEEILDGASVGPGGKKFAEGIHGGGISRA